MNHDEQSVAAPVTQLETGYEAMAQKTDTEGHDNHFSLIVNVDGVHCAACIQKIESALKSEENITHARLNYSTQRLRIEWNGTAALANKYVRKIENLGYEVHPYQPETYAEDIKKQEQFLLLCLGVAGFATGNIMLLSVGVWSSTAETMGLATREFMHLISAMIGIPTIIFSGRPFFYSAYNALKSKRTNMDVPISVALCLTCLMSLYEISRHGTHVYFDSAVMLTFFLLIGRYLDFRAQKTARTAATHLLDALSGFATILEGKTTKRIPISELKEGMVLLLPIGSQCPVNGTVIDGISQIDMALVSGETIPADIKNGDPIYAGIINLQAPLQVKVTKKAEESLISDIVKLMEKAEQNQSAYVRIADKAARLYTPAVHSLALIAFIGWWLLGGILWQDAMLIAITVLIITCPCALGLAVPVVQVLATGKLMKDGILVKSGDALERLASIDTIIMDKTGTLTTGQIQLQGAYLPRAHKMAASLANYSRHPLSVALQRSWSESLFNISEIKEHPGKGIEAVYRGRKIRLGSRKWCGNQNAPVTDRLELWLHKEGSEPAVFYFQDSLRPDARSTIESLNQKGLKTILLSGDRYDIVADIATQANIRDYYGDTTPPEKFNLIEKHKEDGHKILMIGDGLNDAPALMAADISMAPGTAIDISQNAADIIFMGRSFSPVRRAYNIARKTQNLIRQNFLLAVMYNIIAIPLAFMGYVTPLIAALAMSGSSLLVIANSFRLKLSA